MATLSNAFGTGLTRPHPAQRPMRPPRHTAGLTLLEVLLAIAILSIALLGLAATLTSDFLGIRREGQITATNQAAVQVIELRRSEIYARPESFDGGLPQDADTIVVDGVEYEYTLEIIPHRIAVNGDLVAVGGATPHVFDVRVTIAVRNSPSRTYSTLVVRRP